MRRLWRWIWREPRPREPRGVRVTLCDGRVVEPSLLYIGQDEWGIHVWEGLVPGGAGPENVESVRVAWLPAKTSINLS